MFSKYITRTIPTFFKRQFITKTIPIFSKQQLKAAAELWAAYLPGSSKVSFADLNKISKLDDKDGTYEWMLQKNRAGAVTSKQKQAFIDFLCDKMPHQRCSRIREFNDLAYIEVGDLSMYEPPEVISAAVKHAGIQCSAFGLFPFKSVMRLYVNGSIVFNKKVTCTNPNQIHYDARTNLDAAPLMVITGRKFKLFEIVCMPKDRFYEGYAGSKFGQLYEYIPANERTFGGLASTKQGVQEKIKYIRINLDDFLGTEAQLLSMSNEDLRLILQDPMKIRAHFVDHMYIIFDSKKQLQTKYWTVGSALDALPLGENYYQETTGVVRVLSALQNGTVGDDYLEPVAVKDFLIYRDNTAQPAVISARYQFIEAKLCDAAGHCLSDEVFKPGMELPGGSESSLNPAPM